MKREVAGLSGNFRRACPHSMRAEGFAGFLLCGQNIKTHGSVCKASETPARGRATTVRVEKQGIKSPLYKHSENSTKLSGGTK